MEDNRTTSAYLISIHDPGLVTVPVMSLSGYRMIFLWAGPREGRSAVFSCRDDRTQRYRHMSDFLLLYAHRTGTLSAQSDANPQTIQTRIYNNTHISRNFHVGHSQANELYDGDGDPRAGRFADDQKIPDIRGRA